MTDAENGPMNKLQLYIPNLSMEFHIKHYAENLPQWFSVGQNYPTWLPSKFSTTLEPPLIFGKFLQSSAGTTPIYEHLKTMQEMMQHE